jgi:hypothetical protein
MSFLSRLSRLERVRGRGREARRQQALDACLRLSPFERAQQLLAILRRAAERSSNPAAIAAVEERVVKVIDSATATAFLLSARRCYERFTSTRSVRGMAPNCERLPGSP